MPYVVSIDFWQYKVEVEDFCPKSHYPKFVQTCALNGLQLNESVKNIFLPQ